MGREREIEWDMSSLFLVEKYLSDTLVFPTLALYNGFVSYKFSRYKVSKGSCTYFLENHV